MMGRLLRAAYLSVRCLCGVGLLAMLAMMGGCHGPVAADLGTLPGEDVSVPAEAQAELHRVLGRAESVTVKRFPNAAESREPRFDDDGHELKPPPLRIETVETADREAIRSMQRLMDFKPRAEAGDGDGDFPIDRTFSLWFTLPNGRLAFVRAGPTAWQFEKGPPRGDGQLYDYIMSWWPREF